MDRICFLSCSELPSRLVPCWLACYLYARGAWEAKFTWNWLGWQESITIDQPFSTKSSESLSLALQSAVNCANYESNTMTSRYDIFANIAALFFFRLNCCAFMPLICHDLSQFEAFRALLLKVMIRLGSRRASKDLEKKKAILLSYFR